MDIGAIVSIFLTCVLYAVLFANTTKNLDHAIFLEAKGFFELKQYLDMFNSLQEGILVIKEKIIGPLEELDQHR
jgi:hypothetical protein